MELVGFWLNHHRIWATLVLSLVMWLTIYLWYFWPAVRRILLSSGKPVSWRVDMVTKRGIRGGRKERV